MVSTSGSSGGRAGVCAQIAGSIFGTDAVRVRGAGRESRIGIRRRAETGGAADLGERRTSGTRAALDQVTRHSNVVRRRIPGRCDLSGTGGRVCRHNASQNVLPVRTRRHCPGRIVAAGRSSDDVFCSKVVR